MTIGQNSSTDLNEIVVFVKVAQLGSFTAAARSLGMPNSTVSARVSSLEKRLGVTLMQRTTRQVSLTQVGRAYFESCLTALNAIEGAEAEVSTSASEPRGTLRVTMPAIIARSLMPDLIAKFLLRYPKVELELILADRLVDLIGEGVDLALRAGEPKDSSMIMKRLGISYFATFASPAYVKKFGLPEHPKDLRDHTCLQYTSVGREGWDFSNRKTKVHVPLDSKLVIDDLSMIKSLALNGSGIALLPTFLCGGEAESGKLVRVLSDWTSNSGAVNFIYPAQKFVTSKVQAFMELTTDPLRERLKEAEI